MGAHISRDLLGVALSSQSFQCTVQVCLSLQGHKLLVALQYLEGCTVQVCLSLQGHKLLVALQCLEGGFSLFSLSLVAYFSSCTVRWYGFSGHQAQASEMLLEQCE